MADITPPEDQIKYEQARLLLRERERSRRINIILAVIAALAIAGMVFMYIVGIRAEQARDEQIDRFGRCVAEQLAEHRQANEAAHQALAEALGVDYSAPPEHLPPPVPDDLRVFCDEFVR